MGLMWLIGGQRGFIGGVGEPLLRMVEEGTSPHHSPTFTTHHETITNHSKHQSTIIHHVNQPQFTYYCSGFFSSLGEGHPMLAGHGQRNGGPVSHDGPRFRSRGSERLLIEKIFNVASAIAMAFLLVPTWALAIHGWSIGIAGINR